MNLAEYINKVQQDRGGSVSHVELCKSIHAKISEINIKLHEADALRVERIELTRMLNELGDTSIKKGRTASDVPKIDIDDNTDEAKTIRQNIARTVKECAPITNRTLIQKIGTFAEERKYFRGIKILGEKGIIIRNSDRELIPGDNWTDNISDV